MGFLPVRFDARNSPPEWEPRARATHGPMSASTASRAPAARAFCEARCSAPAAMRDARYDLGFARFDQVRRGGHVQPRSLDDGAVDLVPQSLEQQWRTSLTERYALGPARSIASELLSCRAIAAARPSLTPRRL